MQFTGFVRKVDSLGRITLPAELRRKLTVDYGDSVEVFLNKDDYVVIRKYEPCDCDTFTGEIGDSVELVEFEGKMVSVENIRKMAALVGFINDEEDHATSAIG